MILVYLKTASNGKPYLIRCKKIEASALLPDRIILIDCQHPIPTEAGMLAAGANLTVHKTDIMNYMEGTLVGELQAEQLEPTIQEEKRPVPEKKKTL